MRSRKEGDFLVVECIKNGYWRTGKKMIICYNGEFREDAHCQNWDWATAKFMINMADDFREDISFGINRNEVIVRKPTMKEYLTLAREVRKHGLIYNKKKKELCPIMTL